MADKVTVRIQGDESDLVRAFDRAGDGAKDMARDIDRATGGTKQSFGNLSESIDSSENKFTGLGDTIEGTGDVMDGFREGNIVQVVRGFADLASGIVTFVIPALVAFKSTILTSVIPALTAVAVHPLFLAILAAGAIIVGLILLEKKFGIVSKAIDAVKEAAMAVFDWFKNNWDDIANIVTAPWRTAFNAIAKMWNATVGKLKFEIPDWVPGIGGNGFSVPDIPVIKFHEGGTVPGTIGEEVLGLLQAGEMVVPRGQANGVGTIIVNVSGIGMGRDFGMAVAQALRDNKLIGLT